MGGVGSVASAVPKGVSRRTFESRSGGTTLGFASISSDLGVHYLRTLAPLFKKVESIIKERASTVIAKLINRLLIEVFQLFACKNEGKTTPRNDQICLVSHPPPQDNSPGSK